MVRAVTGCLAGMLILTASAGCVGVPAGTTPVRVRAQATLTRREPTLARTRTTAPQTADAKACGTMTTYPAGTADEIMAGRLAIAPFPAVTIDPQRDGDIDWSMDPFDNPTWVVDFQAGEWVEALIEGYLAGGPRADAYRDRAKAILTSWLSDVPIQGKNPETLMCSGEAFPGQAWLHDQIPVLLDYYAANWQGAYNHGLQQDLELLRAGCAYPASAWGGQPVTWRNAARQQMIESFEPNQYGPAVDAQGAVSEQATGYANFDLGLWTTAERELAACGSSLPSWITSRIAQIPLFLALATEPDGKLAQIGDTYVISPRDRAGTPLQYAATMGAAGTPPAQRVGVYSAGYVFGRSGWGTGRTFAGQSFYSLRFGPGTEIHGHDDHMGLTYYARGRNLIVNAGHYGYADTPYRLYLLSPEAASVLVMPGVPFNPAAPTALIRQDIGAPGQFFEFYDTAFGGLPRYRSVYIDQDPDLVLVFDRASGASTYQQLWHLDPSLEVTTVTSDYVIAQAPGTQLEIRQIPLPGQVIPPGSTQVIRGQTGPYQGWVSHASLQMIPAPVVAMNRTGPSTAILTLIAPASPGAAVTAAVTGQSGGWYQLSVQIASRHLSFLVGTDGYIKPGKDDQGRAEAQ
jgi:Heparinase II/III-like protein